MEKWNEQTIGELADVKGGKRLPKGKRLTSVPTNHPYIRIRDIGNAKILQLTPDYEYVDDETQEKISKYIVAEGDILISVVGTVGLVGIVGDSLNGANQTENCDRITNIRGVDRDYLYYYLRSPIGQAEIKKGTVGAVQPKLPLKNIQNLCVKYPSLETQRKMVSILSLIDEKIAVNSRINQNLLQQALCLFEKKFITHSEIERELPLYDFADYINGAAFKPNELGDVGLPVIKIAELKAGITGSTRFFSGDKGIKYLVHNKDILFSWSGNPETSIDLFIWSYGDGVLNQHAFNVKSRYNCPWFTFLMLKYYKPIFIHIASNKQTTGLGHVTATDLKRLTFPFDIERMREFETMVTPIMDLYYDNLLENQELNLLRDSLLPKLMSGELDVSSLERQTAKF